MPKDKDWEPDFLKPMAFKSFYNDLLNGNQDKFQVVLVPHGSGRKEALIQQQASTATLLMTLPAPWDQK